MWKITTVEPVVHVKSLQTYNMWYVATIQPGVYCKHTAWGTLQPYILGYIQHTTCSTLQPYNL